MRILLYLSLFVFPTLMLNAAPPKDSTAIREELINKYLDSVKQSFHYDHGLIQLPGGKANINVPPGFKFLNQQQTEVVLTEYWGNPPSEAKGVLGMVIREEATPLDDSTYAFIVEYDEMGYIKDDDAEKINYDDLLKDIRESEVESNKERVKEGYEPIHLVGWAQHPFYDKERKVLHWAKEIRFGDGGEVNTLNYNIRLLGRHGVLILNAVCSMNELPMVKADISKVLNMAEFTSGNAYADFDPKVDKVAAWTIGGLVAGKVLTKVGFFAIIVKYLAAFWKFILLGVAAAFGFLKNLFKRRKKGDDEIASDTPGTLPVETPSEPQE
ncbi:putative membrane-anchored protein [Chitinophaga terrae (ex Kim and Jung 2007)]|uniref:DUF2167 domain-containing protein n=1 Tax=Chitinophaga terrae (ex Kim and Jung 2007) TaxID=408074 RepID=UPI0027833FA8|nr:DUF2167 domain-containing protein [Chitinophaga terrae (ex Kim and Jung 2007)]MDQ0110405.1 putative membrane-anchored protein [Chitinophaga terrae (ex Kim and Jung 2007)]